MMNVPTWEWVTIAVCVLLSGFFSGSETAFVSLSRAKVQTLLEKRHRKRDPLRIWHNDPSALLTSILIGNNLVNIGASALATDIASRIFPNRGLALAVGTMTLVILVCGEITPKVMARRYAERMVLSTALSLALFYYLTWPMTRFFTWLTKGLIRITGSDPERELAGIETDELQVLVSLSAREGGLEEQPADLISRVLKFQERTVKDAMVPRTSVVALDLADKGPSIMEAANRSGHSRMPVVRESLDEVVGVFHVKDLLRVPIDRWQGFRVAEQMHPPYFVPESALLGRVLREFQRKNIHLAVVVDEFGGTEGIITLEDILEELVGDIQDEFDRDILTMRRLPSGAVEVTGQTSLDELGRLFPLAEEDVEAPAKTVGGLIMEMTGKVPVPGETVEGFGLRFTVVVSDERQIMKVRVQDLRDAGDEGGEG